MKRMLMAASLLLALVVGLFGGMSVREASAGRDYNCEDFTSREEAQEVYNRNPNDPYGLDGPIGPGFTGVEGVVCEGENQQFNGPYTANDVFPPPASPSPSPIVQSPPPSVIASPSPASEEPISSPSPGPSAEEPISSPSPGPSAEEPSVDSSPSVFPPSFPPTVEPGIPGTLAPDAVTVQVETVVDDALVGTVDFFEEIAPNDGVSIQAAQTADANDLIFIVVDLETGIEIDRDTADANGRATLDAEFDAAFYVAVADTDNGSEAIVLSPGESVSFLAVQYVASGVTPSTEPTAPPMTAPTAPPAVDPTTAPSTGGGAITLPNTGTGTGSPAEMTVIALLLTVLAGAAIALGTVGLFRGRRA